MMVKVTAVSIQRDQLQTLHEWAISVLDGNQS